jgi:DNA-binding NarL/FixJ family response regulator
MHQDVPNAIGTICHEPREAAHLDLLFERVARLTPRERDLFDLFAEGLTNQEIADRLYLSLNTVRNYTKTLLEKLGLHNKISAAVLAARLDERQRQSCVHCAVLGVA